MSKRTPIVYRRSKACWVGRYYDEHPEAGKCYLKTLATDAEVAGLPEAERDRLLEVRYEEIRRRLVRSNPVVEGLRVSTAVSAYLLELHQTGRRPATLVEYERSLSEWVRVCGDHQCSEVDRAHLNRYLTALRARLSPEGVAKNLRQARAFWRWCEKTEIAPAISFPTVRLDRREPPAYSLEEIVRIDTEIRNMRHENALRAFTMLRWTGMRASEVLKLRLRDIKRDWIVVETTKQRREHRVPISTALRAFLQSDSRYSSEIYYLDDGTGRPAWSSQTGLTQTFRRICKRLGIENRKPLHSIRSFVATQALASGADVTVVQALLGHSSIQTTLRYVAKERLGKRAQDLVELL